MSERLTEGSDIMRWRQGGSGIRKHTFAPSGPHDPSVCVVCGVGLVDHADVLSGKGEEWIDVASLDELREGLRICRTNYHGLAAEYDVLRTEAERLREALERTPHRRDCHINPGGKIMEALGDPEIRPCSCGRDDALSSNPLSASIQTAWRFWGPGQ